MNSTLWAIVCRQFLFLSSSVPVLVTITTSTATRIWHRCCIDCSCWLFGHVNNFTDKRVNERVNTDIHSLYCMYFVVKLPYRAILFVTNRQREVQRNAQWPSAQSCVFQAAKKFHTKNKTPRFIKRALERAKRRHHTGNWVTGAAECGHVLAAGAPQTQRQRK